MTKVAEEAPARPFAPLAVRGFRTLWAASVFSNMGSFFQITAGAWLMWEMTASPAWVGWMTASRNLPLLLLSLPAGVLADRIRRSTMLVSTQIGMGAVALAMALLTWAGWMTAPLLLALGLLLGVGIAFHAPAWQALVPDLVPRSMVTSAVALNSVSFNAARAVGPALGGIFLAAFGASIAFGLNSISYVLTVVAIVAVGKGLTAHDVDDSSIVRSMMTGVRFARHTRAFRRLLMLGTLFALGTSVLQAMLPVRAEELGQAAGGYGFLLGAFGAGAVLGGITVTRTNHVLGSHAIPVTVALTGAAGLLAGVAPSLLLTAPFMFTAGMAWVWTLATVNGAIQLMSPDWVRGRAVSLWLLAHGGMVPVGAIVSGLIAERLGAGPTMVVLSAGTVVLGVGSWRWGIQDPSTVEPPEFTPGRRIHEHPRAEGGPVMVVNTWHICDEDLPEFLRVMRQVRLARLSTGGSRWQLYRQLGSPMAYSEAFLVPSWDEHISQHQRLDDKAVAVIAHARRLDSSQEGPTSHHYLGLDIHTGVDLGGWDSLDTDHDSLHVADGSVPLARYRRRAHDRPG